jgi:hypothetical protein
MQAIDREDAYREGHDAGGRLEMGAIDCPYLPPDPRRDAWMAGFGDHRPSVSRASDPSSFSGGTPPNHPLPEMHEG